MSAPTPSTDQPLRDRMSVGAWIGIGAGLLAMIVFGVGGSFAGYRVGAALGTAVARAAPDPKPMPAAPEEVPLGHLVGDLPLDRDVTVRTAPQFHATVADGWEDDSEDPSEQYFTDGDTLCYLVVPAGEDFSSTATATDGAATRAAVDAYVAGMRDNTALKAVTPTDQSSVWLDVNDGKGRMEFLQSHIAYEFSDTGEKWQSFLIVRAFAETSWVDYAFVDCPAGIDADTLAGATEDAFGSLSVRG
ncbi:MAG: hypothetical protein J0I70_12725 [Microbacterium sp.]|uniref:hypothetical protein n=1 Tax=unclassified Microbacterium TaxID=2609290 RepID=UPI0009279EB5|nr:MULTISPECIES: hypothetical protein [unclassified Microbacterium]MBN9175004.1 hypothetical protein [Microbacterium sp.]MBN9180533.1 hypothetical protein [Microbacterium sp.]MBN9184794.1 hypothetical protein [Microbacterium sp.]MBN9188721.1 hypothetical protein [Microbacterium sp.]MBN9192070.1 hypothetical protein [Microbacterium sp.]